MRTASNEPTPFFSELDATEGFAPVATATRAPRPAPVSPPRTSTRLGRSLFVDGVVIVVLAIAMIFLAQVSRDAALRSGNVSLVAPHTGVLWTLARASWSSLLVVAAAIAALYALLFRRGTLGSRAAGRHAGGIALPLVVLLVLFALPVGVVAGAARLASRQTVAPPQDTPFDVSGDGTAPSVPPEATAQPTAAPSEATSGAAPAVAGSGRAPAPTHPVAEARTVPATPKQPKTPPTPVPTAAPKATPKPSASPQKQGGGQQQKQ